MLQFYFFQSNHITSYQIGTMTSKPQNNHAALMKWMLEDVRKETLQGIEHLSKEQLFQNPAEGESPIGSYLMHLAECEIFWLEVLSGIEQPEELKNRAYYNKWFDSSETADPPRNPPEWKEYLDVLNETTKNFLDYVSSMKDDEFEQEVAWKGRNKEHKFRKKWIVYHILEHEAHHRGQMFMLIRKAGWNKKRK